MGQYWCPVNLDKKEFIHPHKLGSGLRLREQIATAPGVGAALIVLMAAMPMRRGGGDLLAESEVAKRTIGRWAGDRVAIIGDYAKASDLDPQHEADLIMDRCVDREDLNDDYLIRHEMTREEIFTDITADVCSVLEDELCGVFEGDGFRRL